MPDLAGSVALANRQAALSACPSSSAAARGRTHTLADFLREPSILTPNELVDAGWAVLRAQHARLASISRFRDR